MLQLEMTLRHDNDKKQLEEQLKAAMTDTKMLQINLDEAQANEKELKSMVASLEAQVLCTINSHFRFLEIRF